METSEERNSAIRTSLEMPKDNENKKINIGRTVYTACLCGGTFVLGWTYEQSGVALLDLQNNSRVSLTYASLYLTAVNIVQIIGSLFSSILFGKVSTPVIVFANAMGVAASVVSVPWCTSFIPMLIAHCTHGLFGGFLDSAILAETLAIWGENSGAPLQAMFFLYECGMILSPLSTTPFLTDYDITASNSSTCQQLSLQNCINTTCLPTYQCSHSTQNATDAANVNFNSTGVEAYSAGVEAYSLSELYVPYSISAVLCVISAFPFIVLLFRKWRASHVPEGIRVKRALSMKLKITILAVTGVLTGLDTAMEETYGYFLTVFSVTHMEWTKFNGGLATSLFYAACAIGHFLGIFLASRFKPLRLMIVFVILLCIANVCFIFSGLYKINEAFWFFCVLAGIGNSVTSASLFTLAEESFFPVTGKIAAYFVISSCLGSAFNSFLVGFMMENYSSMYLFYILCVESFVVLSLVAACIVLLAIVNQENLPPKP